MCLLTLSPSILGPQSAKEKSSARPAPLSKMRQAYRRRKVAAEKRRPTNGKTAPKVAVGGAVKSPTMESRSHFVMLVVATTLLLMAREAVAAADNPIATAKFACQGGKTISATFYSNSVELKLSDGRSLKVPQTMSGSGARYAADEPFVFWNKGDTAFITEGGGKETYSGCVIAK